MGGGLRDLYCFGMATRIDAGEAFNYLGRRVRYVGQDFEVLGELTYVSARGDGRSPARVDLEIGGFDVSTHAAWTQVFVEDE